MKGFLKQPPQIVPEPHPWNSVNIFLWNKYFTQPLKILRGVTVIAFYPV